MSATETKMETEAPAAKAQPKAAAKAPAKAPAKPKVAKKAPAKAPAKGRVIGKKPKVVKKAKVAKKGAKEDVKKDEAKKPKKTPVNKQKIEKRKKMKEMLAKKPLKAGHYRIIRGSKVVVKKQHYIEKPIGGANNGGTRRVLLTKPPAFYAAQLNKKRKIKRKPKTNFKRLRPSITPGTVCIVVAGVHKGKRVVFLKRLDSGLCLVNGPFKINGCPLRRVNQIYLIATSTKLDIGSLEIPANVNDNYFRRTKAVRAKKEEGDIFEQKTEKYVPSEERKEDQKKVDSQLISVIKKFQPSYRKLMFAYLGSTFALRNRMYPHLLKF